MQFYVSIVIHFYWLTNLTNNVAHCVHLFSKSVVLRFKVSVVQLTERSSSDEIQVTTLPSSSHERVNFETQCQLFSPRHANTRTKTFSNVIEPTYTHLRKYGRFPKLCRPDPRLFKPITEKGRTRERAVSPKRGETGGGERENVGWLRFRVRGTGDILPLFEALRSDVFNFPLVCLRKHTVEMQIVTGELCARWN